MTNRYHIICMIVGSRGNPSTAWPTASLFSCSTSIDKLYFYSTSAFSLFQQQSQYFADAKRTDCHRSTHTYALATAAPPLTDSLYFGVTKLDLLSNWFCTPNTFREKIVLLDKIVYVTLLYLNKTSNKLFSTLIKERIS